VILFTSVIVGYAYTTEFFIAYYSGNQFERAIFYFRPFGEPGDLSPFFSQGHMAFPQYAFWTMVFCNVVAPQLLWSKRARTTPAIILPVALLINVGMWLERFTIITISLHRDFLPSSWRMYHPTYIEIGTFIGSFGLFFTLFLLFCRLLPMIAISEVKGVLGYARGGKGEAHGA
jgi:molybdopterin-containing oxidoreductase family membrane subunit